MKRMLEPDDGSQGASAPLSTLESDAARAARTRQRCRAALQHRVRVAAPVAPEPDAGRGRRQPTPAEQAFRNALAGAVGILWLVYVVALITITASLR